MVNKSQFGLGVGRGEKVLGERRGTMKKLLAVSVVLFLFAVVMSGCGGKTTTKISTPNNVVPNQTTNGSKGKELQLKTVGFTVNKYGNGYNLGGILTNPNKDLAAVQVTISVTTYGPNDMILGTRDETIGIIPPNQDGGFSSQGVLNAGQQITRVDAKPRVTSWSKMDSKPIFTFSNTSFIPDNISGGKVTGVITNSTTKPLSNVQVTVVLTDANGKAQSGYFTFANSVPAGQGTPFEINLMGNSLTPTNFAYFGSVQYLEVNQVLTK
jgi:hypothetical protein